MTHLIENHPFGFFLPNNSEILMVGTFPPQSNRWCMNFHYPNFYNDMWRIMGIVFYHDRNFFIQNNKNAFDQNKIETFLCKKKIGIAEVARKIIREKNNASDKYLKIIETWDIQSTLRQILNCHTIYTTGEKASEMLAVILGMNQTPKIGEYLPYLFEERELKIYRMPSSSRAYPKKLEDKAKIYAQMFKKIGILQT